MWLWNITRQTSHTGSGLPPGHQLYRMNGVHHESRTIVSLSPNRKTGSSPHTDFVVKQWWLCWRHDRPCDRQRGRARAHASSTIFPAGVVRASHWLHPGTAIDCRGVLGKIPTSCEFISDSVHREFRTRPCQSEQQIHLPSLLDRWINSSSWYPRETWHDRWIWCFEIRTWWYFAMAWVVWRQTTSGDHGRKRRWKEKPRPTRSDRNRMIRQRDQVCCSSMSSDALGMKRAVEVHGSRTARSTRRQRLSSKPIAWKYNLFSLFIHSEQAHPFRTIVRMIRW